MNIIKKIEIKHFRSFLGSPSTYATELLGLGDVNILSGANDSGKSNVLRALNLFFNDHVGFNEPLLFERDFFIGKKERVQKVIEIGISFDVTNNKKDAFLPDTFKITKYYDRNGYRNSVYSFYLKELSKNVQIDSRADKNKGISKLFLPKGPSTDQVKRAEKREWIYRVKFGGFLNQAITFEYVPAIRDRSFFAQLLGRVITQLKNNEERHLDALQKEENKINSWQKTITNKSDKKDFKANLLDEDWRKARLLEIASDKKRESKLTSSISTLEQEINTYSSNLISSIRFLPAQFKIGKDLKDFFEGFEIGTGENKTISLNERGDGIQAKFVPKILDFLSQIDSQNKYYIWAIEEPENSAEYKNQQQLAKEIKEDFSQTKQIFLTTHSEEFLQLYDGSEIEKNKRRASLYHVKKLISKDKEDYSQVFFFDVDKNEFEFADQKADLDDDLGQSYLRAKYSKELKNKEDAFLSQIGKIDIENQNLKEIIKDQSKPILFVEDKYTQIYKIAWLKINNINCTEQEFDTQFSKYSPFSIFSTNGASSLVGFLRTPNVDYWVGKKVVGLFDFDETGVSYFKNIKDDTYWNTTEQGAKTSGLYKKRSGHDCFYAMLLPIPDSLKYFASLNYPSFVEIENLLPGDFLVRNNFVKEKVTTGNAKYLKVKDSKKPIIWKSVLDLDINELFNFIPLYETVYVLFGIEA
ncbi:MAG: AAA family ATPase [Candidatus Saccharibacteria bacterium]